MCAKQPSRRIVLTLWELTVLNRNSVRHKNKYESSLQRLADQYYLKVKIMHTSGTQSEIKRSLKMSSSN